MIEQAAIALTGVTAIFLTQSRNANHRRYACLFGLAGQPFWIWAAWADGQWGVLLLTMFYTFAWAKGVWTHWLAPLPQPAPHPLTGCGYAMSEPGPRGYRLVLGFETREQLQTAHRFVAEQARAANTTRATERGNAAQVTP